MGRDYSLKGSLNPSLPIETLEYNREFRKAHPDFFPHSGITIFSGSQGSGKTLSMVQAARKILNKYPKCILCSNTDIKGLPEGVDVRPYEGISSLVDIENGEYGVLYCIDEIHLEFNSLESKSIPIEVFTEISQQRKQRKAIFGTSQLFVRLAKPFREQASRVVMCSSFLGLLQYNVVYDGASLMEDKGGFTGDILGRYLWFHSPELYQSYDTYAKIRRYGNVWKKEGVGSSLLPYADLFDKSSGQGG